MMVDRSTWCSAAASAIVTSCRTSCNQISYFWETDRNRFARLPARSVPRSDSDMIRSSTIGRRTRSMLSDPGRDLYHEVRRKPRLVRGRAGRRWRRRASMLLRIGEHVIALGCDAAAVGVRVGVGGVAYVELGATRNGGSGSWHQSGSGRLPG